MKQRQLNSVYREAHEIEADTTLATLAKETIYKEGLDKPIHTSTILYNLHKVEKENDTPALKIAKGISESRAEILAIICDQRKDTGNMRGIQIPPQRYLEAIVRPPEEIQKDIENLFDTKKPRSVDDVNNQIDQIIEKLCGGRDAMLARFDNDPELQGYQYSIEEKANLLWSQCEADANNIKSVHTTKIISAAITLVVAELTIIISILPNYLLILPLLILLFLRKWIFRKNEKMKTQIKLLSYASEFAALADDRQVSENQRRFSKEDKIRLSAAALALNRLNKDMDRNGEIDFDPQEILDEAQSELVLAKQRSNPETASPPRIQVTANESNLKIRVEKVDGQTTVPQVEAEEIDETTIAPTRMKR